MNQNLLFLFKDAVLTLWSLLLRAKWELNVIKTMIMLSLIRFENQSGKAARSLGMVSICWQQAKKLVCVDIFLLPKTSKNAAHISQAPILGQDTIKLASPVSRF